MQKNPFESHKLPQTKKKIKILKKRK